MALLERVRELEAVDALLGAPGRVLILEGEAGIGKTRLVAAAQERGRERGFTVLRARGGELEREFGYGIVQQLLGARSLPPAGDAAASDDALYWLTVDEAERHPLLLCVDDAHWADVASLRWLVYLARRLEGLPVAVVLGWRTGEPGAPEQLLAALRAEPLVDTVRPGALSTEACATIARETLGAATSDALVAASAEVSGGNPFLLGELLQVLLAEGVTDARQVRDLGSSAVAQSVLARLSRLPAEATVLVRALAVLEDAADLRLSATLSGLAPDLVVAAASELADAHILDSAGGLRFAHPLLRTSIYGELRKPERAAMHHRTARLLDEAEQPDRSAVHLLHTEPAGDAWAARMLGDAAIRNIERGAAATAVPLLRRAVAEPPSPEDRLRLTLALGRAMRLLGDRDAADCLRQAMTLARTSAQQVDVARELSAALVLAERGEENVEMLEAMIAGLPQDQEDVRLALETELVTLGLSVEPAHARMAERLVNLAERIEGATPVERAVLAAATFQQTAREPHPEVVEALARRAWAGGRLAEDTHQDRMPAAYVVTGLRFSGQVGLAREYIDATVRSARAQRAPVPLLVVLGNRAWVALAQGDLVTAEADAWEAVRLGRLTDMGLATNYSVAVLVSTLTLRGDLVAAADVLRDHDFLDRDPPAATIQDNTVLLARAELWHSQGDHERALRDVGEHIRRDRARGAGSSIEAWRLLAITRLHQGDVDGARKAARWRLGVGERFGIAAEAAMMRATLGLVDGDLALLEQAATDIRGTQRRLLEVQVLIDLGGARRRANRRADARDPLRRALDLAHGCGAGLLVAQAQEELVACGARPRRLVLSGADSLTASERRVAELAAGGDTTKQIAQALFVTPKTVETHLRSIFRKLDIRSRTEIAAALGTPTEPVLATVVAVVGDDRLTTFDSPSRAIRWALHAGVRAGIDIGECTVSGDDIRGEAADRARRAAAAAGAAEVLVTATVKALVGGAALHFDPRGELYAAS